MFIKKILQILKRRKKFSFVTAHATLEGANHYIADSCSIILGDGAQRNQLILKNSCWLEGTLHVRSGGIIIMHEHSRLAPSSEIQCVNRVEIGPYTTIAAHTTVCDNNNHPISPQYREFMRTTPRLSDAREWKHSANAPIIIGRNCWIGSNVRICKGVSIGDNSIIAACSVVTKSVPANCIAAGNPAKVVKTDINLIPAPSSCEDFNLYVTSNKTSL